MASGHSRRVDPRSSSGVGSDGSFWGFRPEESQMASAPPRRQNSWGRFCSSRETMGLPSPSASWGISSRDVPAPLPTGVLLQGGKNPWRHSRFPPSPPWRLHSSGFSSRWGWGAAEGGGTSGSLYVGPDCMSGTEAGALCQWLGVFYFIFHKAMSRGSWCALGDREDVSKF